MQPYRGQSKPASCSADTVLPPENCKNDIAVAVGHFWNKPKQHNRNHKRLNNTSNNTWSCYRFSSQLVQPLTANYTWLRWFIKFSTKYIVISSTIHINDAPNRQALCTAGSDHIVVPTVKLSTVRLLRHSSGTVCMTMSSLQIRCHHSASDFKHFLFQRSFPDTVFSAVCVFIMLWHSRRPPDSISYHSKNSD